MTKILIELRSNNIASLRKAITNLETESDVEFDTVYVESEDFS